MTGEHGVRIVSEVAAREGVDPTELKPPLHDVIDPEALEALFEPTPTSQRSHAGSVSFVYRGYDVTVTASGEISVTEITPTAERTGSTQETAVE